MYNYLDESVRCPTDGVGIRAEVCHGEGWGDSIVTQAPMMTFLWCNVTCTLVTSNNDGFWGLLEDWQQKYQTQHWSESVWSMLLLISGSPMTLHLCDIKRGKTLGHNWQFTFLQSHEYGWRGLNVFSSCKLLIYLTSTIQDCKTFKCFIQIFEHSTCTNAYGWSH